LAHNGDGQDFKGSSFNWNPYYSERTSLKMKCELENIFVHYEAYGEGKPILMLHGWPLDHRQMVKDMEPLFTHRDGWKRIYGLDYQSGSGTRCHLSFHR